MNGNAKQTIDGRQGLGVYSILQTVKVIKKWEVIDFYRRNSENFLKDRNWNLIFFNLFFLFFSILLANLIGIVEMVGKDLWIDVDEDARMFANIYECSQEVSMKREFVVGGERASGWNG